MYKIKLVITTTQGVEVHKEEVETPEKLDSRSSALMRMITDAIKNNEYLMLNNENTIIGINSECIVSFKLTLKEVIPDEEDEDSEKSTKETRAPSDPKPVRKSLIKGR